MHKDSLRVSGRNCPTCGTQYPPGVLTCPQDGTATEKASLAIKGKHSMVGTFVGSYRVQKVLGRGAMGEVFLGEHPILGKRVAIKILREEVSSDRELVTRFFAEAKAVVRLAHPNIVEVLDFSVLPDGRAYYIMEYLEGQSLARRLSRQKCLSVEEALPLFAQLLEGLAAAHELGIIHRDIKPANVFLVERKGAPPLVKLLDFGVAKLLEQSGLANPSLSLPGMVLGTPAYMSPEQCFSRKITPASDIYSVGVMLFEALTGELPFGDKDENAQMEAHAWATPPRLKSVLPECPEELDALLARVLDKKPEARPGSARELAEALSAIAGTKGKKIGGVSSANHATAQDGNRGEKTSRPTELESVTVAPDLEPVAAAQEYVPTMYVRKTPEAGKKKDASALPFFALAGLGVVLLLGGAGWFLTRPSQPPPPPAPSPTSRSAPVALKEPTSAAVKEKEAETVLVVIEATPEDALIEARIDGEPGPVASGRLELSVARQARVGARVSREGYQTVEQEFSARDQERIFLHLAALPTPEKVEAPTLTSSKESSREKTSLSRKVPKTTSPPRSDIPPRRPPPGDLPEPKATLD